MGKISRLAPCPPSRHPRSARLILNVTKKREEKKRKTEEKRRNEKERRAAKKLDPYRNKPRPATKGLVPDKKKEKAEVMTLAIRTRSKAENIEDKGGMVREGAGEEEI